MGDTLRTLLKNTRILPAARWSTHFLASCVLFSGLACSEPKHGPEQKHPIEGTGIYLEPYAGKVAADENGDYYQESRFLVRFSEIVQRTEAEQAIKDVGGRITGTIPFVNSFEVEIPSGLDGAIAKISQKNGVAFAGRNYYLYPASVDWDNDEYAPSEPTVQDGLWWSSQIRLSAGLTFLEESTVPRFPVTIAIIEPGGFNVGSPHVSFLADYGFDFGDFDQNVQNSSEEHSTNVSYFAAARNNGLLTNGVASSQNDGLFQVLPLKFGSDDPLRLVDQTTSSLVMGDQSRLLAALNYVYSVAEKSNAGVVNLSLRFSLNPFSGLIRESYPSRVFLAEAIKKLNEKNILVIVAAGNDSGDACIALPSSIQNAVAVGATEYDFASNKERRWTNSNYSNSCVQLWAPGNDVLYFSNESIPTLYAGTSFSSPMVTGLAALIKSVKPDATKEQVLALLTENADSIVLDDDPVPALNGTTLKRINVERTLKALITGQPQYAPQLCTLYPEGHENRVTFDVVKDLPGCGGQYAASFNGIEADGSAKFVFFQGTGPLEVLNFAQYQQITVNLLGLGSTKLELCENSPSACSYSGTSADASCTATLAGDRKFICP